MNIRHIIICAAAVCVSFFGGCKSDHETEQTSFQPDRYLAPVNIKTTDITHNSVKLAWQAGAQVYEIQHSLDAEFVTDVVTISDIDSSPYTVGGLEPESRYYFRVRGLAVTDDVEPSHYSVPVSVTMLPEDAIELAYTSELKLSATPAELLVDLTWTEEAELTHAEFVVAGETEPAATFDITVADVAAKHKLVTDAGPSELEPDTEYNVTVYKNLRPRGMVTVRTASLPDVGFGVEAKNSTTVPVKPELVAEWTSDGVVFTTITVTARGIAEPVLEYTLTPADLEAKSVTLSDGIEYSTIYDLDIFNGTLLLATANVTSTDMQGGYTMTLTPTQSYIVEPGLVVTSKVKVEWAESDSELTRVTFTKAGTSTVLEFTLTPQNVSDQWIEVSEGLEVDATYMVRLYAGTSLCGSKSVTTLDNPSLTTVVTAASSLEFSGDPVEIIPVIDVSWADPMDVTSLKLTKSGDTSPSIEITLDAADIAARTKRITEDILFATQYAVDLYMGGIKVGSATVTTKSAGTGGYIYVLPSDDLGAKIAAATATDVLYITPGEHTLQGEVTIDRNIEMIGDPYNMPTVKTSTENSFIPSGDIGFIKFSGIKFDMGGGKHFLYNPNGAAAYTINELRLENCLIDLGDKGGAVFSCSAYVGSEIKKFVIDNCMIYDNASAGYSTVVGSASSGRTKVSEIEMTNSTVAGAGRGLFLSYNSMKITVKDCTVFNANATGNTGGWHFYNASTDTSTTLNVTLENTIFYIPPAATAAYGGYYYRAATADAMTASVTNSYHVKNGATPRANPNTNTSLAYPAITAGDVVTDIFENPHLTDPTTEGASYKIKSSSGVPANVGDPRWR